MNEQTVISTFNERLRGACVAGLESFMQSGVEDIQQSIAAPVERVGSVIVRSAPGEPPRRDSSDLYNSVQRETLDAGTGNVQGAIFTRNPVGKFMEYGTVHVLPRPFWAPARERLYARVDELKSEILGSL